MKTLPTEQYFDIIRGMIAEQGEAVIRVTGCSMQPLLRHFRDRVVLVRPETVRRGDIVLFDRKNGRYALHRVLWTNGERFHMAGDNQWHVEYDLPCSQIAAKVEAILRGERKVSIHSVPMRLYAGVMVTVARPKAAFRRLAGCVKRALKGKK